MTITEFAKCETMALRSLPARPALSRGGYATPVATYVRHLVFGHLAREPIEEPDAMTFDRRTPLHQHCPPAGEGYGQRM